MAELILVSEGKSDYTIIIAADAAEPERFAAFELQKYISLISSAKLPIKEDAREGKAILVGTKFADRTDLGEDGFVIKTEKERIILGGNTPRATLFSVYAFLEKYLGCGWCIPGDDTVPENKTIIVSEIDDIEKPVFSYRGIVNFPYNAQRACTANTHLRIPYAMGTSALQCASFSFVTTMGASAEFSPGHCCVTASKPQSLASPFTFGLVPVYHQTGGL